MTTTKSATYSRRKFITLVGGGVVGAAAIGATAASFADTMPSEAIVAWSGPGPDLAASDDPRRWILSYAILAPNPHNLQAWQADLSVADEITLLCDPARLLPETDPFNRQVLIGHGAFLELLTIAAAEKGYDAQINLFPQGTPGRNVDVRRPIARILLVKKASVAKDSLFKRITERSTNRETYDAKRPATTEELRELLNFPVSKELVLAFATETNKVAALNDLAVRAWEVEQGTPRTWNESVINTHIGAAEIARYREGICLCGPSIWWAYRLGLLSRAQMADPKSQAFAIARDSTQSPARTATAWVWIKSEGNTRATQIAAGRAYVRLGLRATEAGLALQPFSQALQEFPEMRERFEEIKAATGCGANQTLQMFARIGRAPKETPSPRRPLTSFVRGTNI